MSLISTGNKHDINAFDALTVAFSSNAEIILREGLNSNLVFKYKGNDLSI